MDLLEAKVLVTPTTFGMHDPRLKTLLEQSVGEVLYNPLPRALSSEELIPLVEGVDGFIAGLDRIDASVIRAAARLKVIARYGVGLDNVDMEAATAKGIVVTNTPGANSAAVAELALALILGLTRGVCKALESTRSGLWPRLSGAGLKGKTVGILGFGRIGKEAALRLKGFDCRVLVFDPQVQAQEAASHGVIWVQLEELLEKSDIVSLHVPLTPSTRGMVDKEFLGKMKRGSFLVNTARGELLDEEALLSALQEGRLAGAALDCLSEEPPPKDHPLLQDPRVMVTPHMGAHTDQATSAMGWMSLEACLVVLKGERPAHVVNPQVYGA
jgi:D-3-phosphoglycerate dehydrogenase